MDILITGGRGQLGTELQKILECGRSELGEIPCELQAARCTCVDADELDIADAASVEDFFSQNHFDLVFNCEMCIRDRSGPVLLNLRGA